MDILCEQIVHKKQESRDVLYKLLIITGVIGIPAICILVGLITNIHYFFVVAFFLLLLCIYGAWYFWTSLKVDYEYSVFSDILTISKIIANRKRKNLVKLEIRTVDLIEKYNSDIHDNCIYEKVYTACKERYHDNYAVFFPTKDHKGKCMLIFSPNEKLLSEMKRYLRGDLRNKI